MINKRIYPLLFLAAASIFAACSKDEVQTAQQTVNAGSFTYSTDNGTTMITADSAYFDTRYNTIKAFKGGSASIVEINLSADTVGVYTIGGLNAVSYLNGTTLYVASTGAVTINSINSSKTTGVFTSTNTSATLIGNFTNINVK
jgi:hypothetical protein